MGNPDEALIMKAASLASVAPREWQEFLTEVRLFVSRVRDDLVAAPVDKVQVAQGQAQGCVRFSKLLEGAVVSAGRIAEKRK